MLVICSSKSVLTTRHVGFSTSRFDLIEKQSLSVSQKNETEFYDVSCNVSYPQIAVTVSHMVQNSRDAIVFY